MLECKHRKLYLNGFMSDLLTQNMITNQLAQSAQSHGERGAYETVMDLFGKATDYLKHLAVSFGFGSEKKIGTAIGGQQQLGKVANFTAKLHADLAELTKYHNFVKGFETAGPPIEAGTDQFKVSSGSMPVNTMEAIVNHR